MKVFDLNLCEYKIIENAYDKLNAVLYAVNIVWSVRHYIEDRFWEVFRLVWEFELAAWHSST